MAKGAKVGGGGHYFKFFRQRGAIIRGRRLLEGRLLFEEMRYLEGHATMPMITHFELWPSVLRSQ